MRNWHTRVIKLTEAKNLIDVAISNGNPDIYVGVIEGKMEYSAIDNTISKHEGYNYKSSNKHLVNEIGDRKVIYRERYDNTFYDESLQLDDNELNTMTHTTSVVGIIAGKDVGDNIFGICPDIKIINSDDDFEVALLLSLINEYTKGNINSQFYEKNILIKNTVGGIIDGTGYLDKNKLPFTAMGPINSLSNRKCSIISCSFSLIDYSDSILHRDDAPKKTVDFVFKELFAYGRDGRGVLVVFSAGNEDRNIDNSDLCSAYSSKTLIVAASKVTIDNNNMNFDDEDKASYSNYGKRVDICAPSCPKGYSAENEIEIYSPTAINCGEIGDNDQIISATVLFKFSNTKLILDDKYDVIFIGQSIEIGNPIDFTHEVRFIIGVETVLYPSNSDPTLKTRTKITLDQPLVFTKNTVTSANVKICIFKKSVSKFSTSQLTLDNFNGIGNYQSPLQKAYLYSEDITSVNDFSVGMNVTIKNNLTTGNVIEIEEEISLSRLTNLKLIPGQITTKLIRKEPDSRDFIPNINSSLQGFFSGQQVFINEEGKKRHLKYVTGFGGTSRMEFSQLSSESDSEGNPPTNNYTIKSLAYGNMTSSFGGTSAAAPIVSGVAALVLSANNELNAAEIKHILKETADKITGASNYSLVTNNLKYNYGYSTNEDFGTGRVNAETAIKLAKNWHCIEKGLSLPHPEIPVLKPRLEIADKIVGTTITAVPENEIVDSPDIWVSQLANSNTTPIAPFNQIDTSIPNPKYINIRVRNNGNRDSFKECDLRVFVAFTDDPTPTFPFPTMWYDQTDVKLLAVKEIPIIPFGNEAVIQIEWEDIAAKWNTWNPIVDTTGKRKRAYILAHIAPFDGLPTEVQTNDIRNNKQLTCKEIIVTHNGVSDRTAYLLGNNLNLTVGTEVVTKNFDFTMENILSTEITEFKIKATKMNNDTNHTIEEVFLKKTGNNWDFETAPSSNWIAFDSPTEIVGNHPDYTNLKFPHTINVSDNLVKVKLEIVNA